MYWKTYHIAQCSWNVSCFGLYMLSCPQIHISHGKFSHKFPFKWWKVKHTNVMRKLCALFFIFVKLTRFDLEHAPCEIRISEFQSTPCYMPQFLLHGQILRLALWSKILLEKLIRSQLVKFPRVVWNPKFYYRMHKCSPPVPIECQIYPVHSLTSHFLKIHLNILFLTRLVSSKSSLSLRLPHQNPVSTSRPPYVLYALPNSFFSIWWPEKYWMFTDH
jgi:hypothetical protein